MPPGPPSGSIALECSTLPEHTHLVWGNCSYGELIVPLTENTRSCSRSNICNGHGVCFFGKCFCEPGYRGPESQPPWSSCTIPVDRTLSERTCKGPDGPPPNRRYATKGYDACLRHGDYGSAVIPARRWNAAQRAEQAENRWHQSAGFLQWRATQRNQSSRLYGSSKPRGYIRGTSEQGLSQLYPRLPSSLGRVAEIGCGPTTRTREILLERPDISVAELVCVDPGIDGYLRQGIAKYDDGPLQGVKKRLLSMGAEQVPASYDGTFDSLVMMNVIEHAFNAFATLYTSYRLLRPGGLFIFLERVVIYDKGDQIYHPIRLKRVFFDWFLTRLFDDVLRDWEKDRLGKMITKPNLLENIVTYVGRKKGRRWV